MTYLCSVACVALMGSTANTSLEAAGEQVIPEYPDAKPIDFAYPVEAHKSAVDSAHNIIADTTGSLAPFMEKLAALRNGSREVVSVIHVGDSHVQAGFWDARLQENLQAYFGDAGRGLIVPHKLSGGNEPRDYAIQTRNKLVAGRNTNRDLAQTLGFTGVAIGIESADPQIMIWSKSRFSSVTILHHPDAPALNEPDSLTIGSRCTLGNTDRSTRIEFTHSVDSVTLTGHISVDYNNPTYYGFSLENGNPGVLLHSIGVNSAAFEHFARNTDFAQGGAADLHPDLIIISLGTNNCFGSNYRSSDFHAVAESFILKVKESYPQAALLITTPMEGCRYYRRTYTVNKNLAGAADVLESIAVGHGIACWNLYEAAGGDTANAAWYGKKLLQRDRLHFTEEGYHLKGDMLFEALARAYNKYIGAATGETPPTAEQSETIVDGDSATANEHRQR